MDLHYLKGRLEHTQAMEADIVKVDIEEFANAIYALEEKRKLEAQIYNQKKLINKLYTQLSDICNQCNNFMEGIDELYKAE